MARRKAIALMGCTGIGKSAISAAIRESVNGELISGDSVKVGARLLE